MKIRKARLKDVPGIVDLWKEFIREHDRVVLNNNPKLKPYMKKRKNAQDIFIGILKNNIRSGNGLVLVAESGGKLAGYGIFRINKGHPVFSIERIGCISDIFIKKGFRGKGISSLFRDDAIKFFRKKGIKHLSLQVFSANSHAHEIYRKWGFQDYLIDMRKPI